MSLPVNRNEKFPTSTCDCQCDVIEFLKGTLNKTYCNFPDLEQDFCSESISLFSFIRAKRSTEYADFEIKFLTPTSSAFVLREPQSDLSLETKKLLEILTNYSSEKSSNFQIFFLVFQIHPDGSLYQFHFIDLDCESHSFNCRREYSFPEKSVDWSQVLRDIARDIELQRSMLSSALFMHSNLAFGNILYFSLTIKFLYPYFSGFTPIFPDVIAEIPPDYLWNDIIPYIVEKSRLSSELQLDYIRSLCDKNGYFAKSSNEEYIKHILQIFLKTHDYRGFQYLELPLVSMILEHLIFPYISNTSLPTDIFSEVCCFHIKYSKLVMNALAEFQPGVLKALMETEESIQTLLKHLLHMQSLCGDLEMLVNWMKQSFTLYSHCLDQLGYKSAVLPSKIYSSGGSDRDIDLYVERFERTVVSSDVPRLSNLSIRAARCHIRNLILSKPLPRLSFSSQLESLSNLSPSIKKFVQIPRM